MSIISWDEFRRQRQGEYQLTITPGELRLGDYVARVDSLKPDLHFPPHGVKVESFDQKQWFQTHCRRVIIDLERCLNRRATGVDAALSTAGALPRITTALDTLRKRKITSRRLVDAWQNYRRLSLVAQAQILSFHRHGQVDMTEASDAIDDMLEAMNEQLAALLWLTRIKEKSRYAFQHGLNVAIMAAAFAHSAGWERKVCHTVALAGLLHDLGMMRVSLKVIRKAGPLSPAERDHVELHTRLGYELLAQNDGVPDAVARVALCHQERPDGKGYPEGLTREGIPAMARLIGIISAYDAMMTTRFHRPAISHQQAMAELWKLRGKQFDSDLADAFSRFLGWGPPGTLMRLADGRMAVALHTLEGAVRPLVRVLHRRGEGVEFGIEVDLADFPQGSAADGKREVLLADGTAGISHRDLTRKLPRALTGQPSGVTDESEPAAPRRERRRRPRVDAPRGTKILVVDDSRTIRETLRNMLGQSGYEISVAEDGQSGLALAASGRPDLMFLDIVLPDLSGFRALRQLRKNPDTENLPVVMISGNQGAIEKFFLQRVGADDFIHKPFGRFEVFTAIERLIRSGALPQRAVT